MLAEYFRNAPMDDVVVLSPDLGGVTRARDLANRLNASIAIIDKCRPEPNVAEVMNVIGDIAGKSVIIVDDMIDTAGTITLASRVMLDRGAKEVYACATHPVLSGPALERLSEAPLKEIVITNTIPIPRDKRIKNMTILSVAPLIGEAILRIHEDLSVSKLFD
jgi:ribose-phosphate pyrophosphokinase